jgi:subtilisin
MHIRSLSYPAAAVLSLALVVSAHTAITGSQNSEGLVVSPTGIDRSLEVGQSASDTLTLSNPSSRSLRWSLYVVPVDGDEMAPAVTGIADVQAPAGASLEDPMGPLELLEGDETVRVLVSLNVPFSPAAHARALPEAALQRASMERAREAILAALQGTGVRETTRFDHVPHMALEVDARALTRLSRHPLVRRIDEDIAVPLLLAESTKLVGADRVWSKGLDGAGQAVAVLDTGVEQTHPFLAGRVVAEACFSTRSAPSQIESLCPNGQTQQIGTGAGVNCDPALPGCNHGTHVAGIAAGKDGLRSGVAPAASVISVQVFSKFNRDRDCGEGKSPCVLSVLSDQIKALEHVFSLRSQHRVAAVNMSLGGGKYEAACDGEFKGMKDAIDMLRAGGIATVIASGNDGYTDAIGMPACISSAIAVGSTTKWDAVSSFSNSSDQVALLAPGSSIRSSLLGGSYGLSSGTSMATPHVAGAWALMRQQQPGASVSNILAALQQSGRPVNDTRNGLQTARLDVGAALEGTVTWIQTPFMAGVVEAGEVMRVPVRLDATTLPAGSHNAHIVVVHDDPALADVMVPVRVEITPLSIPTAPAAPLLASPEDNATGINPAVTFTWYSTANATAYLLELGETGEIDASRIVHSETSDTTATVLLNARQQYFWRVTPKAGDVAGSPSDTRSFTTRPDTVLLAGTVRWDNGEPVSEIVIRFGDDQLVRTDANGRYKIAVPYAWSGAAAPSAGDITFDPGERSYEHLTADLDQQDFLATVATTITPGLSSYALELQPPHPNPFRDVAVVRFTVPTSQKVRLSLHDLAGRELRVLRDEVVGAGPSELEIAAGDLASGFYLLRLVTETGAVTRSITLVR